MVPYMVQEGAGRGFDQLRPYHSAVIHPQGFPPTRRTLGSRRCDCPLAPTCNRGDAAVDDTVDASGVGVGIFFKDGLFGKSLVTFYSKSQVKRRSIADFSLLLQLYVHIHYTVWLLDF